MTTRLGIPSALRRFSKRVLPPATVEYLRSGPLRRYYVESLISREGALKRFVRRHVTHRKPVLYHLDVHVTDHCNLRCKGCEHYSSISKPVFADLAETMKDLARLAELFENIEQLYLLGGEPLLHPQVEQFVSATRRALPDTRLYLMTNGILAARMPDTFWATLHDNDTALLCDSYPIDIPVERINELGRQFDVTVEWMKPAEEFFKIPLDTAARCNPAESFDRCRGLSNCAIVRDGQLYPCAHVAYADILVDRFGIEGIDATEPDSISIWDGANGDEIIDFLSHPIPWCAHCDFDSFERYPWSRGKGEVDEWVKTEREAGS